MRSKHSQLNLEILKCVKSWILILPMCVMRCKVTDYSTIFATLVDKFPVASGFTNFLTISMTDMVTAWSF